MDLGTTVVTVLALGALYPVGMLAGVAIDLIRRDQ